MTGDGPGPREIGEAGATLRIALGGMLAYAVAAAIGIGLAMLVLR